jgi:hypothetical protein
MVLMVSNASVDGPGSPPRASCAVSTMRSCALVAAIFVLGLGAAGFVPNALVVVITPSFHRMREIRACLGNERGVVTEVPWQVSQKRQLILPLRAAHLFTHNSGACVKPSAAASRYQGLFSSIYIPREFSGLFADAAQFSILESLVAIGRTDFPAVLDAAIHAKFIRAARAAPAHFTRCQRRTAAGQH